jgi:hypothetical protein
MRPYNKFDHQKTKDSEIHGTFSLPFCFCFLWVVGPQTYPTLSRTFPGSSSQKFEVGEIVMHFCSISNSSGLFLLRKCPHCLQESLLTPSDDIFKMFVKEAGYLFAQECRKVAKLSVLQIKCRGD